MDPSRSTQVTADSTAARPTELACTVTSVRCGSYKP
jgi:hypothetical protein